MPHAEKINVFLNKGLTSVTFGSTWLPNGAAIGLPRTVLFQTQDDVRNSFLESAGSLAIVCRDVISRPIISGAPVDWDSELGLTLTAALTPSSQQINFIIGRHIIPTIFLSSSACAVLTQHMRRPT